jgi:hypothetical protein
VSLLLEACRRDAPATAAAAAAAASAGLRLDLRHESLPQGERFTLVRARLEPPVASRRTDLGWGDYRFTARDRTGAVVFRTAFDSSIAARGERAAARLSVRMPLPARPVEVAIEKRRAANAFQPLWTSSIDPAAEAIDRSAPRVEARVETLAEYGPPESKADLAIVGDGYREADRAKFIDDAKRAAGLLFSIEPYARRARDFNVRAVFVASAESGITDGYLGVRKQSAFSCAYGAGEAERTLSCADEYALREAASAVPYDYLLVVANARRYGGSAYFGGPAVVSIDSAAARYLVIHELSHAIAGLADEYYIPDGDGPAYRGNVEPWQPNVTLSAAAGKWAVRSAAPAAWPKYEYDRQFARYVRRYYALRDAHASEDAVDALMKSEAARQKALLSRIEGAAGLYEGANGYARGVYRSEADCVMFSLQSERFCSACANAVDRAIDAQILHR